MGTHRGIARTCQFCMRPRRGSLEYRDQEMCPNTGQRHEEELVTEVDVSRQGGAAGFPTRHRVLEIRG